MSDWYTNFVSLVSDGFINLSTTGGGGGNTDASVAAFNPYCILMSAASWPGKNDTENLLAQVTARQITASGYSAKQITNWTRTIETAATGITRVKFTFTVPTFNTVAAGQTVAAGLVYHSGTVNSQANPLAFQIDHADRALTGGEVLLRRNADSAEFVLYWNN